MKNSKGISIIALVITIIVIVIITSITVYSGIDMIADARQKDAVDKLKIMCNSLRKDDEFLGTTDLVDRLLTEQDYKNLDVIDYYDEDYLVYLNREKEEVPDEIKYKYTLNMYRKNKPSDIYATANFELITKFEKNNYRVSFDERGGINRPLLFNGMKALTADGTAFVKDVYSDEWYNYNSTAPVFAKMKYDANGDGIINVSEENPYIWIPRFAYSIQNFYNGTNDPTKPFLEVPASAIKIVFLRENTDYMINDEVIPYGYQIHPAFKSEDRDISGFWVSTNTSRGSTTFSDALSRCESVASSEGCTSHLMSNSEYGAVLYLMHAYDSYNEIDFTSQNEFVAAVLKGASESSRDYIDVYEKDSASPTGLKEKIGDAMIETNWNRLQGDFLTTSNQAVVRLMKSGYFDFTAASKSSQYYYRDVIMEE